jgi:hypothetical protein
MAARTLPVSASARSRTAKYALRAGAHLMADQERHYL